MKFTFALLVSFVLTIPAFGQNKIIRDRFNNDVEVWKQSGNRTDVYDPYTNELLRSRYRDGDKTIIRTPDNVEQETEYDH